jgi:hypothetical protein
MEMKMKEIYLWINFLQVGSGHCWSTASAQTGILIPD